MFIIILYGIINLNNYGRRHFKIFTNFHIFWDTLWKGILQRIRQGVYTHRVYIRLKGRRSYNLRIRSLTNISKTRPTTFGKYQNSWLIWNFLLINTFKNFVLK